jgi:sugar phosphate permease
LHRRPIETPTWPHRRLVIEIAIIQKETVGDNSMKQRAQRVKTRHIILAVMCLMYFISYIDRVNIAVAGPLIRHEMGLTTV